MTHSNSQSQHLASAFALKEWQVIAELLARGAISTMLRKGGIAEGPGGFRAKHEAAWIYPTQFHQAAVLQTGSSLRSEWQALLQSNPPAPLPELGEGKITLSIYAQPIVAVSITSLDELVAVESLQALDRKMLEDRFHYKKPGLTLLVTRIFTSAEMYTLLESQAMAGCHSWVDLPQALEVVDPRPALSDHAFSTLLAEIGERLGREIMSAPL